MQRRWTRNNIGKKNQQQTNQGPKGPFLLLKLLLSPCANHGTVANGSGLRAVWSDLRISGDFSRLSERLLEYSRKRVEPWPTVPRRGSSVVWSDFRRRKNSPENFFIQTGSRTFGSQTHNMAKITIKDVDRRMSNPPVPEQELPKDTTIQFELDNGERIDVYIPREGDRLVVRKVTSVTNFLNISPNVANQITIT